MLSLELTQMKFVRQLVVVVAATSLLFNARSVTEAKSGTLTVVALRTEYRTNPLGVDVRQPRVSWQLQSDQRGVLQSAYQIRVAPSEYDLFSGTNLLWDSGKIDSEESIQLVYGGPALQSSQRYHWQVRVWDTKGHVSAWSKAAYWETGLLKFSDWQADWIEPELPDKVPATPAVLPRGVKMIPEDDPSLFHPAPMLRRTFTAQGTVQSARLYVTAHGIYEIHLNGQRVGDDLFTPGWTSYHKRLQYQTYDVTGFLRHGENAIGAVLGDGWYRGFVGGHGWREVYGSKLALLAQLQITYADGRQELVGSDSHWKAATGPITRSDLLDGETYDARRDKVGWALPGYDDHDWAGVQVVNDPKDVLVASVGPPVRRIEEIKPIKIFTTPAGDTVVDFGQNMVGWVRLKVQGPAGTIVTLRHFEVLDQSGNVYTANLRAAAQTDKYVLKGQGEEVFEPHFTFHGFRYVAVSGYPGKLTADSLTGVVIHSDVPPVGELATSNSLVNQLQHAILWGQKGNFLDVPMDCPQRNERLGWTGDTVASFRTTVYNYDVASFFTKWLKDLSADQLEDGDVPRVVPDVRRGEQSVEGYGRAGWADAAVFLPWDMYLEYGDTRILETQYESMAKWVEYVRQRAGDDYLWDGDPQYGDWIAIEETDKDLFATAFFAHSVDLMRRTAQVLGKQKDAVRYGELFAKIKIAFQKKFVTTQSNVGNKSQGALALALQFDLLPEELRQLIAQRLAEDVRRQGHLTTGFVATPFLCPLLTRYGYSDEAYGLLLRDDYPSWLYMIKHGATTIWERWDAVKPDGSFEKTSMNSFNHRALGSIGEWMFSWMAGIDLDQQAPGYKHILIHPQPGGDITQVRASHNTLYGRVTSAWESKNEVFDLRIKIPANTRATVRLPNALIKNVTESGKPLARGNGVIDWRQDSMSVVVNIGSGTFKFASRVGR